MKSIILIAFTVVAVVSADGPNEALAKTVRSDFDLRPDGSYGFGFETENGINRNENGEVKQVLDADNKPQDILVVSGSYGYIGKDGKPESIVYMADENGFRADGESIPKNPASTR